MSARSWEGLTVEEIPMVGQIVRYVCAFCNLATDEDPLYVYLGLHWPYSGESQGLGAHLTCLRAAVHPSIPLAVE